MKAPLLACALLLLGCGDDQKNSEAPDASTADADMSTCTYNGMTPNAQTAERDDDLGVLFYTATAGSSPTIERLTLDFYFPFGARDEPHSIEFDGENLKDCHTCLVARNNCDSNLCSNGTAFLAQAGTADITATGPAGTSFQGTLSNAVFAEVTINVATLETTVVPGGETWCIDSLAFDVGITGPQ